MASILDDHDVMTMVKVAGYGILVFAPSAGASADDEKIERMVIRFAEAMTEIGEDEGANFVEFCCAAIEFTARCFASPFKLQNAPRSEHRRAAELAAKNLRTRILGACRREGADRESKDN